MLLLLYLILFLRALQVRWFEAFSSFKHQYDYLILCSFLLYLPFSGSAPLTAVQLLWVNMIMDTLGALALATEPPNDGLMKRAPVGRGASFITKTMWRNIFGQSIYQLVILAVLQFDGKRLLRLRGPDATEIVKTVIFNTFVFCQVRCCWIKPPLLSFCILLSPY